MRNLKLSRPAFWHWTLVALAALAVGCGNKTDASTEAETPKAAPTGTAMSGTATAETPAAGTIKFVNSREKNAVADSLSKNFVDFSFEYPGTWTVDPQTGKAEAQNFIKVIGPVPEGSEFEPENFAVGYFSGSGAETTDKVLIPQLIAQFETQLKGGFPGYKKLNEGETTVGSYKGYELRFESRPKDSKGKEVQLWGRLVFLPATEAGQKAGVTLVMLGTDVSEDIKGIDDLGVKGDLPMILNSFKLGS